MAADPPQDSDRRQRDRDEDNAGTLRHVIDEMVVAEECQEQACKPGDLERPELPLQVHWKVHALSLAPTRYQTLSKRLALPKSPMSAMGGTRTRDDLTFCGVVSSRHSFAFSRSCERAPSAFRGAMPEGQSRTNRDDRLGLRGSRGGDRLADRCRWRKRRTVHNNVFTSGRNASRGARICYSLEYEGSVSDRRGPPLILSPQRAENGRQRPCRAPLQYPPMETHAPPESRQASTASQPRADHPSQALSASPAAVITRRFMPKEWSTVPRSAMGRRQTFGVNVLNGWKADISRPCSLVSAATNLPAHKSTTVDCDFPRDEIHAADA